MNKLLLVLSLLLSLFCLSPNAGAQTNQTVNNGQATTTVNFPSSGCPYNWYNSTPGIGLPASGSGNIPSFTATNNSNTPVVATITAKQVSSGYAYVPNGSSNNVTVIDLALNKVIATISVGVSPIGVSVSPDGNRAYITNQQSNNISVINTQTNMVMTTITIPGANEPSGVVVSPDGSKLYVSNYASESVSVISTTNYTLLATIAVGLNPFGIAVSLDGSKLYVANSGENTVSAINTVTNSSVATIAVGTAPNGVFLSPDGSSVYVANYDTNDVSVISTATNTVINTIPAGLSAIGVCVSPDGSKIYVTNINANTVSVIDRINGSLITTITVGLGPVGVSLNPDGSRLYVVSDNESVLSVINTSTNAVISTIPVGLSALSVGNIVSGGPGCNNPPLVFTITINPASVAPTITASAVTGNITACVGTASVSPNIEQFTVSGNGLTNNINVTAPQGFEISLTANGGYGNSVVIPPTGGVVSNATVYIRSASYDIIGFVSGNVMLTSASANTLYVTVTGFVNALPTVNTVPNQVVLNGSATTAINFAGTGNTFTWTNNTPGIGLAASGSGDIASFNVVNAGTTPVTATITVTPQNAGFAYITNEGSNNISVISTITHTVVATIPVGLEPLVTVVSPDGSRVYVVNASQDNNGNSSKGTVSVINTSTNKVVSTINVGTTPIGEVISPDGSSLYVTNINDETISVINTNTNTVIKTVPIYTPQSIAISPDGKYLYVTSSWGAKLVIYVVSTLDYSITATIPTNSLATGIVVSPNGKLVYITLNDADKILVVNAITNAVITTIPVGGNPYAISISTDGSKVYVSNSSTKSISVINTVTNTVISTIAIPGYPYGISASPDGKEIYVANQNPDAVSVINTLTNQVTTTITAGNSPMALGNFIASGTGCTGTPITFTITVNPTTPTITTGIVSGNISSCVASAATSPNIEQFAVSGNGLTNNITATAPAGFEISLTAGSGYSNSLSIPETVGKVNSTIIYVRSATVNPVGNIFGKVVLTSAGAPDQGVVVAGVVNALPTINTISNQTVAEGAATSAINFTGIGGAYNWTNNTPGIGLAASGTGDIKSFTAVNNTSTPITATVTVTPVPTSFAYIASQTSNNVSVINTTSKTVITTIPVGVNPFGVSASPDGGLVYVTNKGSNNVSAINTGTNTVIATINVGLSPKGIVVSPDGTRVYVANSVSNSVSVIDATTNSVIATIAVDNGPFGIAISPDGTKVYVTNYSSDTISVIDPTLKIVTATISGAYSPTGIAVTPDGKRVFVANQGFGTILVINALDNTLITKVSVEGSSMGIVVSPDGSKVYIANTTGFISTILTSDYTYYGTADTQIFGISITPDGKSIYLTTNSSNTNGVEEISPDFSSGVSINVGGQPFSLGNFISKGSSCTGDPITFTITVNPTTPTIIAGTASGTISTCAGAASADPNIQQFTASGNGLSGDIIANAPTGFEISLNPGSGYGNTITLTQTAGKVNNTIIYVRSAASAPAGNISGNVILSSTGAISQSVAVTGTVNAIPTVNQVNNQGLTNGAATSAISFNGTATAFNWVNDTPAIGLPASGSGDIASFTAFNNGGTPVIATITITPFSTGANGSANCSGTPITFTITVNPSPAPAITFAGTLTPLTTVYGTPSASTSFKVSGADLKAGITVTPPPGFELSADNVNFSNTVVIGSSGAVNSAKVYIRLTQTTAVGNYTGNIVLSSTGATSVNVNMPNSTVTPAPLTITANNANKTYGATLTGAAESTDFTSVGLQNKETIGSVTLTYGKGFAANDAAITYTGSVVPSTAADGTFTANNYTISYLPGDIIVVKAILTVTADDKTKTYNTENPPLTVTYTGFVNNEGPEQLLKQPDITTTATKTSPVGEYAITPGDEMSDDYTFNNVVGTLTIRYDIVIPNAFTPNGDGINDTWNIVSLSSYPNCLVNIYDRYGQLVYVSPGYTKPWDGTVKGKVAPMGVYYYIINLRNGNPPYAGYVTLIR